jgi:hypothetical protein
MNSSDERDSYLFRTSWRKGSSTNQGANQGGESSGNHGGHDRFIFTTEDELHSIAKSLIDRGSVFFTDVAAACNEKLGSLRGY